MKKKAILVFKKILSYDKIKPTNLEVSRITFPKPLKRKIQMQQKTVKTLDLIKSLIRKSNKIFVPHEIFQRKTKNKGENS